MYGGTFQVMRMLPVEYEFIRYLKCFFNGIYSLTCYQCCRIPVSNDDDSGTTSLTSLDIAEPGLPMSWLFVILREECRRWDYPRQTRRVVNLRLSRVILQIASLIEMQSNPLRMVCKLNISEVLPYWRIRNVQETMRARPMAMTAV